uniref:Uncharacterized protein n=1 Tax=Moniliophthora roreri TaxID=221103 RepID=A0A0W0GFR0_MONRR
MKSESEFVFPFVPQGLDQVRQDSVVFDISGQFAASWWLRYINRGQHRIQRDIGLEAMAMADGRICSGECATSFAPGYKVQYAFYFFTYLTAAWGYCLVSWLSDIYRREPEARAISIGTAVTLVYVGHATIPLRAFRVSDSPRYPIGFPLSLAFAVGSIITMLAMKIYVSKHEKLFDQPFLGAWTGNVQEEEDVEKLEDDEKLDAYRSDEQIQK